MTAIDWTAVGAILTICGIPISLILKKQNSVIEMLKESMEQRDKNFNVLCQAVEHRVKHFEEKAGSYQELQAQLQLLHELKPKLESDKAKLEEEIVILKVKKGVIQHHQIKDPRATIDDAERLVAVLTSTSGTLTQVLKASRIQDAITSASSAKQIASILDEERSQQR